MTVHTGQIELRTDGRGFFEVTAQVQAVVEKSRAEVGLANVFVRHTSASLIVNENADPDVRRDLERFLQDLVPDGDPRFIHTAEGPDDMSAHVRSVLTATSVSIPVRGQRLCLGTWQGIYLWEHRKHGHVRRIEVTVVF